MALRDAHFGALCRWLKSTGQEMHVDRYGNAYFCRRRERRPRKWMPPLWPAPRAALEEGR